MKKYFILLFFLILGSILFQGFQCATPEVTNARLYVKNRDWQKAEEWSAKAFAKNPKDGESALMLAQAKLKLGKTREAAEWIIKAEKLPMEQRLAQQIPYEKYNIWIAGFNEGITAYNQFYSTKDNKDLEKAIDNINICLMVRPQNADVLRIIGRSYEELGNIEKIIETYKSYQEKLKNEIEFAKSSQVFIMMPRSDIQKKFGKAKESFPSRQDKDSLITDLYSAFGREIYIYYSEASKSGFQVEGWRVSPPNDWLPDEKTRFTRIEIEPFAYLAQHYYEKALEATSNTKLDTAVRAITIKENLGLAKSYMKLVTALEPTNEEANRFLISIYQAQGESNEALIEVAKLVESDPKNPFYLSQYGEIHLGLQNYDESIKQYLKALEIDPNFCDALRNIAAAYKNKSVTIIQEQQDKKDRDKNYQEKPEEYLPLLIESAKYFNKCKTCEKYKNDLAVLSELANLYYGISNLSKSQEDKISYKDQLNSIVDNLERLEQTIPDNQKELYWLKMCKILSDMNSTKSVKACAEAQKYMK